MTDIHIVKREIDAGTFTTDTKDGVLVHKRTKYNTDTGEPYVVEERIPSVDEIEEQIARTQADLSALQALHAEIIKREIIKRG
jgi:hypothetical protein